MAEIRKNYCKSGRTGIGQNKSRGAKGQMFLIGAIIMIVVITLIKTSINFSDVLEKKKFLESGVERLEFANLREEVPRAAHYALNYSLNATNVTISFLTFAESSLASRAIRLDGVVVSAYYLNLSASTNVPLNVTVYNFFDTDLSRVVLNLSTNFAAPISTTNLPPGSAFFRNFTINLASSQNLTLWVFYERGSEREVQNVTVPAVIGKTKHVGYYDLRMLDDRGTIQDRFTDVVDVN
jgi:hypothetical protein